MDVRNSLSVSLIVVPNTRRACENLHKRARSSGLLRTEARFPQLSDAFAQVDFRLINGSASTDGPSSLTDDSVERDHSAWRKAGPVLSQN
jgi:hypothetical protein